MAFLTSSGANLTPFALTTPSVRFEPLYKIFGALIEGGRFAEDSPLERDGFEPSVPQRQPSAP
jgi:hypothetical protein